MLQVLLYSNDKRHTYVLNSFCTDTLHYNNSRAKALVNNNVKLLLRLP